MNLSGDSDNIIEWSNDDKPAWQGDLTTQPGAFRCNRLFQDLDKNMRLAAKHLIYFSRLDDLGFILKLSKIQSARRFLVHREVGKFQKRPGIRTEVRVMQKSILFKSYVNECRV